MLRMSIKTSVATVRRGTASRKRLGVRTVIFTGGTGSVALQRGLYRALDTRFDGIDTKVIVNAYDNGLSTGIVRRVMDGQILGPSDVRKNQATRLRLENPASPWLEFVDCRFTTEAQRARTFCASKVTELVSRLQEQGIETDSRDVLLASLDSYFQSPIADLVEYRDFSLANVVYSGLAAAHGNSLRAAATIMARAMGIADNVLLNDDQSLFLGAVTRSGHRIKDEGEIVCWGSEADPISDVFFWKANGEPAKPHLCLEAWRAIVEADLIVLSSGTLWSSLIPTYASEGFRSAINSSKASILMVMNRTPDRDSPGQSASEIVTALVPRYFEAGRLRVVADENSHPRMRAINAASLAKLASFTEAKLSTPDEPPEKHDPDLLAAAIGKIFFREYLDSSTYVFDYDDTLVGRNRTYPRSSRFNVQGIWRLNGMTQVGICSGNTINAIRLGDGEPSATPTEANGRPLKAFADGGINEYAIHPNPTKVNRESGSAPLRCVCPAALLPAEGLNDARRILAALQRAGISGDKLEIRGNAIIAIRPVEKAYRRAVQCLVSHVIAGSDLVMRERGTTTIEICSPTLSKYYALKQVCAVSPSERTITYVGDELESGNDHEIAKLAYEEERMRCLYVDSPAETAFFIATLLAHLEQR